MRAPPIGGAVLQARFRTHRSALALHLVQTAIGGLKQAAGSGPSAGHRMLAARGALQRVATVGHPTAGEDAVDGVLTASAPRPPT